MRPQSTSHPLRPGPTAGHVVEALVVEEPAVSGAALVNRLGLVGLLDRLADFDILLCWDFSRLSRDAGDLGVIRNRLRLARRTAYEVSTGLEVFNIGAKVLGVMNEEVPCEAW